jgi:hypothetical protein
LLSRSVIVALVLLAVAAPVARADGDPASDYLLTQSLFVPPDTGVSSKDAAQLRALLLSARNQGYTLHVAVIASRYDMGSVTVLFDRPLLYAPFLSQELRFYYKKRVLVVTPVGDAIANNGNRDPIEQKLLTGLPPAKPFQGAALAAATERAIRVLTTHAGVHVVAATIAPKGGGGENEDRLVIVAGVAVLLAIGGAFTWLRRRAATPRREQR